MPPFTCCVDRRGNASGSSLSAQPFHRLGFRVSFFSRLLVPRSVRRGMHPGRAVKLAVTPKAVKRASRALHPIDNAVYSMERSATTAIRSGRKRKAPVFRHGNCPVHHRRAEAAAKCRNP
jgi:hypothetical protein